MEENKCAEIVVQSIIKNKKRELMCCLAGYSGQKELMKLAIERIKSNDERIDLYENYIRTLYRLCTIIREREKITSKNINKELESVRCKIFETAVTLENSKYSRDKELKEYLKQMVYFDINQSCETGLFSYNTTLNYVVDIKNAHDELAKKYLIKSYQK